MTRRAFPVHHRSLAEVEQSPERATTVDPESKPPERAAVRRVDGAGGSSEVKARQCAAADRRPLSPVGQETQAKPGAPAKRVEAPHSRGTIRGTIRGAQTVAAQSGRARAVDAPAPIEAPVLEHRQQPLARPRHYLTFDRWVVIAPDRPASPRYYKPGSVMLNGQTADIGNAVPFRDDLNAIADRGSPGRPPPADASWHGGRATVLV